MDTITIIGILIGLAFGIFFLVVEKAFDKMFNQIFRLIGLKSSTGPIRIHVSHKNHIIELEICNQGKGKAMLVAIEGFTHIEASNLLEISGDLSRQRLSRAKSWIQKYLLSMELDEQNIRQKLNT